MQKGKNSLEAYYGSLCGPDLGAEDRMEGTLAAFCGCFYPAGFPECWSLQPAWTGDKSSGWVCRPDTCASRELASSCGTLSGYPEGIRKHHTDEGIWKI